MPEEGKLPSKAQRGAVRTRIIIGLAVFDKGPAWYYATLKVQARVRWRLKIKHKLSGRGFSDDDVDSSTTGKPISKSELISPNGGCDTKSSFSNTKAQSSPGMKAKDSIEPSCKENLFLRYGLIHRCQGNTSQTMSSFKDSRLYYAKPSTISRM